MKSPVYRLDERTLDNMNVLRDCVDLIINNLPYTIPAEAIIQIPGHDLRGLPALVKKYSASHYAAVLDALKNEQFIFKNRKNLVAIPTYGTYSVGGGYRTLVINISAFMGQAAPVTREELLAHRIPRAIKSFRGILLHELRHLFQSHLYSRYFTADRKQNYGTDPIEIDAAWSHHLEDHPVGEFANAGDYVTAVMQSFAAYKQLSDELKQHYRAKTARYYYDSTTLGAPQSADSRQRLVNKRAQSRDWLVTALAKIHNEQLNLRLIPGYDTESKRFLLPGHVADSVRAMISKDRTIEPAAAPIAYFVCALVTPPDAAAMVRKHLQNVQKITLEDALTGAANSFVGGWDVAAMIALIRRVFG